MNSLFRTIIGQGNNVVTLHPVPSNDSKNSQKLLIENLTLEMFIGVTDQEQESKQSVIVHLEADVMPDPLWQKDDIANVVSYADLVEAIKTIAAQGSVRLVETFAEKIIQACFSYQKITGVKVKIIKPDILKDVSVGIEISRTKF